LPSRSFVSFCGVKGVRSDLGFPWRLRVSCGCQCRSFPDQDHPGFFRPGSRVISGEVLLPDHQITRSRINDLGWYPRAGEDLCQAQNILGDAVSLVVSAPESLSTQTWKASCRESPFGGRLCSCLFLLCLPFHQPSIGLTKPMAVHANTQPPHVGCESAQSILDGGS